MSREGKTKSDRNERERKEPNHDTDDQASSLSERPRDGDHTLSLGGDGVEGTDGEIKRVSVVASRANVPDGGGNSLAVVVVLDVDDFAAKVGSLREVVTPVAVGINGNSVLGVGVVVSASTGVAVLVEVGSETTGLVVTGRRSTGRSLGGLLGLGGPSGGRGSLGDPGRGGLSSGLGGDGLGVGGLGLVVGRCGLVDRGGRRRDRGGLGSVGSAVWESGVLEGLGGEHGGTTVGEELRVLFTGTSDGDVSSVVYEVRTRREGVIETRLTGHVWLEVTLGVGSGCVLLGDRSGLRNGSEGEESG